MHLTARNLSKSTPNEGWRSQNLVVKELIPSSRATVAPEKTKATQIGLRGLTYLTNVKDEPVEMIVTKGQNPPRIPHPSKTCLIGLAR
jgi:hypothetical protein